MDPTYWTLTAPLPAPSDLPALADDVECDICVVGAGIAGLTTAYRLATAGFSVVVLDAETVASGETHHTSAHLTCAMDDRIYRIAERFGADGARLVVQSHSAAIDWIEQVASEAKIDCDFRRVPGYLFLGPSDRAETLERERDAARAAGVDVQWLDRSPLPGGDAGPALVFPDQAEFHPVKFLSGLAAAIRGAGGRIHGNTRVVDVHDGTPCGVETADGPMVTAEAVLLATNAPSNDTRVTMKMVPYRTFLVAMRAAREIPHALWWDTASPYHYIRVVDGPEGQIVLSGGGDYQTGTRDEGDRVYHELEQWTRGRFPVAETVHRWSGQVYEPSDWLGFIGRLEEGGNVYACTGDSGQGLTNGTICAMLVGDLVQGVPNAWEKIYALDRVTLKAVKDYAVDAVKIARNFVDKLKPGEVSSEAAVAPGHGAILRQGKQLVAVYRDPEGTVHRRSAACTHAGCIVHWDSSARIWACPCHGSRFHPEGGLINGPATSPLAELEPEPAKAPRASKPAAPPSTRKRSRGARAPKR